MKTVVAVLVVLDLIHLSLSLRTYVIDLEVHVIVDVSGYHLYIVNAVMWPLPLLL